MRLNKLVHFIKNDDGYIVINPLIGEIDVIDSELYNMLISANFNLIPQKIFEMLKDKLIIVQDNYNEFYAYENLLKKLKFDVSFQTFTILVTRSCNFECVYCYEHTNQILLQERHMNRRIADEVIEFINRMSYNSKKIKVIFYGGEPLLNINVLTYLMDELESHQGQKITFELITNGYLVKDLWEKYKKYFKKFKQIQITLDGPPEIHNKLRPLRGGLPTFETIITGIKLLTDNGVHVALRSNLYLKYIKEYPKLLDELDRYGINKKYLHIGIGFVHPDEIKNYPLISKKFLNLYLQIKRRGFSITLPFYVQRIPCGAITNNSFVIDYNGDIYKCWALVGLKQFKVGTVQKGISEKTHRKFLSLNPLNNLKCRDCPMLMFCGGGCIYNNYLHSGKLDLGFCPFQKYSFREYLQLFIKELGDKYASRKQI
ncbi:radical SAM protein [Thermococcus sp. 21S7]|uniref:radical SAM/SPASM domain-containing protein n=1 Tax=Thermococcus sp. 21S7 TaxID=1638221 RepID=UPI001438A8C4|nr:radical SAM protein [Thermococcus sp. 21S7]NJE61217.1 SPASM domain-containing protein [Thermococcus sp. 21S7]